MADGTTGLRWGWVFGSMLIFVIAQAVISLIFGALGVLTLGLGFILFVLLKPVTYFLGGIVTGLFSPGITIAEPAIGAVVITILGALLDASFVRHGRLIWTIISSIVAFFLALAGARIGERVQGTKQ